MVEAVTPFLSEALAPGQDALENSLGFFTLAVATTLGGRFVLLFHYFFFGAKGNSERLYLSP